MEIEFVSLKSSNRLYLQSLMKNRNKQKKQSVEVTKNTVKTCLFPMKKFCTKMNPKRIFINAANDEKNNISVKTIIF